MSSRGARTFRRHGKSCRCRRARAPSPNSSACPRAMWNRYPTTCRSNTRPWRSRSPSPGMRVGWAWSDCICRSPPRASSGLAAAGAGWPARRGAGALGLPSALVPRDFGARDLSVGETNPLRRNALHRTEEIETYAPGSKAEPADNSVDLVIDAVGASATRAAASRMVRPGGVIVHLGLLPGADGLDIRKITLQEIAFTGSYCYTPLDFRQTVAAIAGGRFGKLRWFEQRPLSEGVGAFASIDAGSTAAAKIILRP